jgi:hypothetical protein
MTAAEFAPHRFRLWGAQAVSAECRDHDTPLLSHWGTRTGNQTNHQVQLSEAVGWTEQDTSFSARYRGSNPSSAVTFFDLGQIACSL